MRSTLSHCAIFACLYRTSLTFMHVLPQPLSSEMNKTLYAHACMCTAWQLLPQPTSPRYCYTLAHMLPVLQLCEADTYEVSICTLALYRKFQEIISLVAEYAYIIST